MKVLMFGWEFPPIISGGLGIACQGIAKGLVRNNIQVKFVLPTDRGQKPDADGLEIVLADKVQLSKVYKQKIREKFGIKKGQAIETAEISPYYTEVLLQKDFQDIALKLGLDKSSVLSFTGNYGKDLMVEVLRYALIGEYLGTLGDFDIIHAHDWLSMLAGAAAKRVSGKPLVVHIHATECDRSGNNMNYNVYNIERYGMQQADRVVAVSYYTKKMIIDHYNIAEDKIDIVHNAVSRERQFEHLSIKKPVNGKLVLFLGRVTMQKGPDYFLEAANLVLKKLKNVHFVMAGSGDMMPRLIERMAELKIMEKFHFTGFLSRLEVEKMYAMCDLYVMPSVSEPFGITAFEALLYDVPIVLSNQSGVAEVLKGAVLVDFWDVSKLANTIVALLKNQELAREVVARCRERMKSISWDNAGLRLMEIYTLLIK